MAADSIAPATTGQRGAPRAELISPAGDWDCARAAVENGADAVYFGLDCGYNARGRAANFREAELPELMAFLHRRGLKGYVALNTLAFPTELAVVERTARHAVRSGVDAVLVQDLGVLQLLRAVCPELTLHASTQMTLTSAEGIQAVERLGVQRVVLARELSVHEIRRIRQTTTLSLEVFVHGALCVAYSGQCLTSESLGGRSANRGECAQACRLPYELIRDGHAVDLGAVRYLLSPQDLAAYALIPELLAAGVNCFKIEGRLKKPEYVANITRHYREAVDAAVAGRPVEFTPRQVEEMELSFSRGFCPGWLRGSDHKLLVPGLSSAKRGVLLGRVTRIRDRRVTVVLASAVARGDGVVFEGDRAAGDEQGGRVFAVYRAGQRLEEPVRDGTVELLFDREAIDLRRLWVGQSVWKTDDPQLTSRWRKTFTHRDPRRRVPLDLQLEAGVGQPLRIVGRADNGAACRIESAEPLAAAVRHPLTEDVLRRQLGRLGGTAYELRSLQTRIDGTPMAPLSVLGQLRHALVRQLDESAAAVPERTLAADDVLAQLRAAIGAEETGCATRSTSAPRDSATGSTCATGSASAPRNRATGSASENHVTGIAGLAGKNVLRDASALAEPVAHTPSAHTALAEPVAHGSLAEPVAHGSLTEPVAHGSLTEPVAHKPPQLRVLCRNLSQLQAVLREGVSSVLVDFPDIREYRTGVSAAHAAGAEIYLATPRIQKPREMGIFRALLRYRSDGVLVRNLGGLAFFADCGVPVVADFSLNAANELTVDYLRRQGAHRVTVCYDLNRDQLLDLVQAVPPHWLEVVVHQHMPLFHMEHCVICAALSPGTSRADCGRPCDRHAVRLRDHLGMEHPLQADVGCRNTLFNAVPQSASEVVPTLLERGVRDFRIELLDDDEAQVHRTIALYRALLAGQASGREVWRQLQAANRVGVTRGTLEARRDPLAIV